MTTQNSDITQSTQSIEEDNFHPFNWLLVFLLVCLLVLNGFIYYQFYMQHRQNNSPVEQTVPSLAQSSQASER